MKLDRNTFPPGGWQFYQPETKWNAPDPLINSFARMVKIIADHRAANPKAGLTTDQAVIAIDLENFTKARLGIIPAAPYEIPPERPRKRSGCGSCGR